MACSVDDRRAICLGFLAICDHCTSSTIHASINIYSDDLWLVSITIIDINARSLRVTLLGLFSWGYDPVVVVNRPCLTAFCVAKMRHLTQIDCMCSHANFRQSSSIRDWVIRVLRVLDG